MPAFGRNLRPYLPQIGVVAIMLGVFFVILAVVIDGEDDGPSSEGSSTTAPGGDNSTSTTDRTADPELDRILLTLEDLPDGWEQGTSIGAVAELCDGRDPVGEIPPDGLGQAGFTRGAQGPVLSNVVADYGSDERADELLDAVREAIAQCGSYETDSGQFQLTETDPPDVGDDAVAAHLTGDTAVGALEGRILYVRVGGRITAVALAGFEGVDPDVVTDAAAAVAGRL